MSLPGTTLRVLLLPDWQAAGPAQWPSQWPATPGCRRVEQHDWSRPLRGDWLMQLEEAVLQSQPMFLPGPDRRSAGDAALPVGAQRCAPALTLVALGLGCQLVAAWAACSRHVHLVHSALLVAPTDVEREALRPRLASWTPVPARALPFPSLLLGRRDDPQCSFERARAFARAWGSEFIDGGEPAPLEAGSALDAWPPGRALVLQFLEDRARGRSCSESGQLKTGRTGDATNHH